MVLYNVDRYIRSGNRLMKRYAACTIISILLFALASCDMSGNILSPAEKEQLYSAEFHLLQVAKADPEADGPVPRAEGKAGSVALSDGSSLKPGDSFSVTCSSQAPGSDVNAILVSLANPDAEIASALFLRKGSEAPASVDPAVSRESAAVLDAPLPVSLPASVESGAYSIRIRFYERNVEVFAKTLSVFILSSPLGVDSIQVCPASVSPGAYAFLQASVDYPKDSRPYLAWSYDGAVIGSGLLSDGFDRILWKSPAKEGVYGLKLSVYPFPPAGRDAFSFESPVSRSAKVVSAVQAPDPTDPFQDPSGFFSLLRFSGDFSDSGYGDPSRKAEAAGAVLVRAAGVGYGYQLDSERSLAFADYLLPVEKGRLGSFSLMGRILAPKKASGSLFRSESAQPGFSLALGLDQDGQYVLSLANRADKALSASGIVADGRVHDIAVSVIPSGRGFIVQWFLDYAVRSRGELTIEIPELPAAGRALFGGLESAQAVFDEFGVFAAPAGKDDPTHTLAWTGAYATQMARTYRKELLRAEGFEGASLPKGFEATGTLALGSGSLALEAGASITLPFAAKKGEHIRIDIQLLGVAGGDFALTLGPTGGAAALIKADGSIQPPEGEAPAKAEALDADSPSLILDFSSGQCRLLSGKRAIPLFSFDDKTEGFSLGFAAGSPVAIESLMLRRVGEAELVVKQGAPSKPKTAFLR